LETLRFWVRILNSSLTSCMILHESCSYPSTLRELESRKGSVIAMSGMTFDLSTPHGRMIATFLSGIAEFERDLISERVKSVIARVNLY
ncbi:MAG: recombinase family protein, partial [Halobacteria archaeon]|nr:recombinase family protein [Halobacteria archaeon]